MKHLKKVAFLWILFQVIYCLALAFFPHRPVEMSSFVNRGIQAALLLLCFFIYRNEPNKSNKFIFLNFFFVFVISLANYLYDFIGVAVLQNSRYGAHLLNQYSMIASQVLLALAIAYMVIDLGFRKLHTYQKYLIAFAITFAFSALYFHDYLRNPLYLYSTEEIKQWKTLEEAVDGTASPGAVQLASKVRLQTWQNGQAVGDLYPEENLKRIDKLLPYLENDNWVILLFKPLYLEIIHMNVFNIGFILIFFLYQYKKDPPQGAYIDKIMFLFLLLSSTEILHYWGFTKSVEVATWNELFSISQYISVLILLLIAVFFALRLRFITSVAGEFYETELASNPQTISRWRDWVDNFIVAQFFNFKLFNGRLFQNPNPK